MRAVNLLSADAARHSRLSGVTDRLPNAAALVAIVGATIVASGLAVAMILLGNGEAVKRQELEQERLQLALIPKSVAGQDGGDALGAAGAPRRTALASALAGRVAWDRVLRRFSLVVPGDVWLTTLALQGQAAAAAGAAPAAGGQSFSLAGYTYSHDGVARLLSRLELLPELADVQLQSSTLTELSGRRVVQFTIGASVRPEAA